MKQKHALQPLQESQTLGTGLPAPSQRGRPFVGEVRAPASLDEPTLDAMFRLFADSYIDVAPDIFRRDLAAKTHVILIRDRFGSIRGFSTLAIWTMTWNGESIRLLFSGDTVVDPEGWGDRAMGVTWLQTAGSAYFNEPGSPLFWLLLCMGHRTYRTMSVFFERYHPGGGAELAAFADEVGRTFFANRYDPIRRLVTGGPMTGRLNPVLAEVPEKDRHHPEVQYFLKHHPTYMLGDEIICLAHLHPDNIRRALHRVFLRGRAEAHLFD